ncbi:hypothetical protein LZ554_003935 [Drepanopeziza brunnea f. sp. 'monogermtubi']|nr:hypothetical protein LZ554_003935 [Drepanopeziza brunnea f. sp. 'monogermtubi']
MGIHPLFPLEGEEGARVVESYSESDSSIRSPPREDLSDEQMVHEQMECPAAVQTSPSKRLCRDDLILCIADFLSDDSRDALALCNKSLFEHLGIKYLPGFGYFDRPRYKVERTTLRQRFLMLLERDVAELIV